MNLLTGHKSYKNEPGGTRTPDTRFRKPLLYPTELLVHGRKLPAFIILYFHTICKGFFQKFQRGRKLSFFENFLSLNRFFFTVFCCNYYCFCSKMCYNNSVVITDTNQMKEVLIMNPRKAAIIGCGFVGSATAFTLMQSRLFSEIVLIDANYDKADGEAKDIAHGIPFAGQMKIYAGDYKDIADAGIVIVTAGANQQPNETRLDLVHKNVAIYKSIIPQITEQDFQGILLIVSNPVDILTYVALKLSGLPENRVIGSGTVLDTARLKYALGEHLSVDSRSVHSFIIGEHGDSEIAAWSSTNVSGIPLNTFCEMRGHFNHEASMKRIADSVKNSAYEIIEKKRATYYGIAMSVKRICECIVRNERSILSISSMMHGEYGIEGIALSMPAIVGFDGVETHVPISLNEEEQQKLRESAKTLKSVAKELDL